MQWGNTARACGSRISNGMQLGLLLTTLPVKLQHDKADSSSFIQEAGLHTFDPSDCARRYAAGHISQQLSVTLSVTINNLSTTCHLSQPAILLMS